LEKPSNIENDKAALAYLVFNSGLACSDYVANSAEDGRMSDQLSFSTI